MYTSFKLNFNGYAYVFWDTQMNNYVADMKNNMTGNQYDWVGPLVASKSEV